MFSRRSILVLIALLLLLSTINLASASTIMPYADTEFYLVTTTLKSDKSASFKCATYDTKNSISVTYCWLEKRAVDGSWFYVCSLTPPSTVITNSFGYTAVKDYSPYIGTGTYRIWATYNADGHTVTRCSNERTY